LTISSFIVRGAIASFNAEHAGHQMAAPPTRTVEFAKSPLNRPYFVPITLNINHLI